jgi:hypothetical protein
VLPDKMVARILKGPEQRIAGGPMKAFRSGGTAVAAGMAGSGVERGFPGAAGGGAGGLAGDGFTYLWNTAIGKMTATLFDPG